MSKSKDKLFWIDLEMTGLDETIHQIVEVAVIVTDVELNALEEYHEVVFQPPGVLRLMDEWCQKTHGESGLTALIPQGKPIDQVEKDLIEIVEKHYKTNDRVVIAGNSVGNDRRFIDKYLPEFEKKLHYRIVDVSSFKEIFKARWGVKFEKTNSHRALDDIHESINELKHYLSYVKLSEANSA